VKLSDGFDTDYRIDAVSLEAAGLFARALAYTAERLTDGCIDQRWLQRRVRGKKARERILGELVAEGLFRADGDGYVIVPVAESDTDRLVHVLKKQEVQEYREKEAEKKRAQRQARRALESEESPHVPEGHPEGQQGGVPGRALAENGSRKENNNGVGSQLQAEPQRKAIPAVPPPSDSFERERAHEKGTPTTDDINFAAALADAGRRA
jgi:hypothetical protein